MDKDKWIDVIAKLTRLTHENKIIWRDWDIYYVTEYKDIRFEIGSEIKGINRKTIIVLHIISGNKLWEVPQTSALTDLLSSIKYKLGDDRNIELEKVINNILEN